MEVIKSQKISIFEVLDYIFCPRIIYYENVILFKYFRRSLCVV